MYLITLAVTAFGERNIRTDQARSILDDKFLTSALNYIKKELNLVLSNYDELINKTVLIKKLNKISEYQLSAYVMKLKRTRFGKIERPRSEVPDKNQESSNGFENQDVSRRKYSISKPIILKKTIEYVLYD